MTHVHIHGGEHFAWCLTQHCGMYSSPCELFVCNLFIFGPLNLHLSGYQ